MSGKASDAASETRFIERDDKETELGYDTGGVPFYVAVLWALLIVAYLVVMFTLQMPDFLAWQKQ